MKFLQGHHAKSGKDSHFSITGTCGAQGFGKDAPNWKGGKRVQKDKHTSYVMIYMPEHPRSYSKNKWCV